MTTQTEQIKAGWNHRDLTPGQILGLRYSRSAAYKRGEYKMEPPPVYTGGWDEQAWCNWVKFNNKTLTGFLPYIK